MRRSVKFSAISLQLSVRTGGIGRREGTTDQLSGHVALRHPQSNENGRYERGEALTENKALSAYFQGRTNELTN